MGAFLRETARCGRKGGFLSSFREEYGEKTSESPPRGFVSASLMLWWWLLLAPVRENDDATQKSSNALYTYHYTWSKKGETAAGCVAVVAPAAVTARKTQVGEKERPLSSQKTF